MSARWVILGLLLAAGCDSDRDLARMVQQPRAEAYGASKVFADGSAMRTPPADTVSRRSLEGATAREVPPPLTRAVLERGRDRYDIYCAACHGVLGDSRTPVADRMRLRRPPSLISPEARALAPGRVLAAVSRGYGLMPSYARQLSLDDRWAVVAYVRALQVAEDARLDALPADARAEALGALR